MERSKSGNILVSYREMWNIIYGTEVFVALVAMANMTAHISHIMW